MEFFNALWKLGNTSQAQDYKPSVKDSNTLFDQQISCRSQKDEGKMKNALISQQFKKEQPQFKVLSTNKTKTRLNSELLTLLESQLLNHPCQLDLGYLVGTMNLTKKQEGLLGNSMLKMKIGKGYEISTITALRQHSLDTVVIGWKIDQQDLMTQLMQCQQRLLFVIQQQHRDQFIYCYQKCLLDWLGELPIRNSLGKIGFRQFDYEGMTFLHFEPKESFTQIFIETFTEKYPSFENIELVPEIITLEDYQQLRNYTNTHVKVRMLVEELQKNIDREIKKRQQKAELIRIDTELWYEDEKVEPARKNNSNETELLAEYFNLKESQRQKQTRDSGASKRIEDKEDLYYFIEPHSESSQSSEQESSKRTSEKSSQRSPLRIHRSKSWNSLGSITQPQIDEELFTKY